MKVKTRDCSKSIYKQKRVKTQDPVCGFKYIKIVFLLTLEKDSYHVRTFTEEQARSKLHKKTKNADWLDPTRASCVRLGTEFPVEVYTDRLSKTSMDLNYVEADEVAWELLSSIHDLVSCIKQLNQRIKVLESRK